MRPDNAALVLVVEDDVKIAALLEDYLKASGFCVETLDDGSLVEGFVRRREPDLILLDIRLPGKSGIDVCRDLRRFSAVPLIMVTAMVEEIDRLLGLELGADDYVCKPFSPREVVARVKAQLRRTELARHGVPGSRGPFCVDEHAMRVELHGQVVDLTPSEFRVLSTLVRQPGRVFSRAQLLDAIHGEGGDSIDRAVDAHIKNIRRKIERVDPEHAHIRSVYGVGYKLELAR